MVWGVQGFYYEGASTTSQTIKETKEYWKRKDEEDKEEVVITINADSRQREMLKEGEDNIEKGELQKYYENNKNRYKSFIRFFT